MSGWGGIRLRVFFRVCRLRIRYIVDVCWLYEGINVELEDVVLIVCRLVIKWGFIVLLLVFLEKVFLYFFFKDNLWEILLFFIFIGFVMFVYRRIRCFEELWVEDMIFVFKEIRK